MSQFQEVLSLQGRIFSSALSNHLKPHILFLSQKCYFVIVNFTHRKIIILCATLCNLLVRTTCARCLENNFYDIKIQDLCRKTSRFSLVVYYANIETWEVTQCAEKRRFVLKVKRKTLRFVRSLKRPLMVCVILCFASTFSL